jgi:hypothetical protein
MDLQELDEIIAKLCPTLPGDCKRSKQKKEWMRQQARERLIKWASPKLNEYTKSGFATGGTVALPFNMAGAGSDHPDKQEVIINGDIIKNIVNAKWDSVSASSLGEPIPKIFVSPNVLRIPGARAWLDRNYPGRWEEGKEIDQKDIL